MFRTEMKKNLCVDMSMNQGKCLFGKRDRDHSQVFIIIRFVKEYLSPEI